MAGTATALERLDRTDAQLFVEEIWREQHGNVVLSLASQGEDGKPVVNRPSWFRWPEQLHEILDFCMANADRDVYLSPIIYGEQKRRNSDQYSRAKSNALTAQVVYMDSDACPQDAFRLTPSVHVESSPGRGHDYWVLDAPMPAEAVAEAAHRIAIAHREQGADPSGWSSAKFLRVPTVNTKYGEPQRITWAASGEVYSLVDIAKTYADVRTDAVQKLATITGTVPAPGVMPTLIEGDELAKLLDLIPRSNLRLNDLMQHVPKAGDEGWRSEQRWGLLLELLRAGFNQQETLSLAWYAAASGKWKQDARGIDGLWYELQKAVLQVEGERGTTIAPAAPKKLQHKAPKLLTDAERKLVEDTGLEWMDTYLRWAAERVPAMNLPLHEANAWTLLSLFYSDVTSVWTGGLPLGTNLYQFVLSPSSTGKTIALRLMKQVLAAVFAGDSPIIGADHSVNNLVKVLHGREGRACLANADEADGLLASWKGGTTWTNGIVETWTDVYDGDVPVQGRISDSEVSRADIRANVSMLMQGTPAGMMRVLTRDMFESGYLMRQLWSLGDDVRPTRKSLELPDPETHTPIELKLMPRHWAWEVARRRYEVAPAPRQRAEMKLTREARERMNTMRGDVNEALEAMGDRDLYTALGLRSMDNAMKLAALTAASDGRDYVVLNDVLFAMFHYEQMLADAIAITDRMAENDYSRRCDEIAEWISGREARQATVSAIYRQFKAIRWRELDEYLGYLVAQGRLEVPQTRPDAERRYKVKGGDDQ